MNEAVVYQTNYENAFCKTTEVEVFFFNKISIFQNFFFREKRRFFVNVKSIFQNYEEMQKKRIQLDLFNTLKIRF